MTEVVATGRMAGGMGVRVRRGRRCTLLALAVLGGFVFTLTVARSVLAANYRLIEADERDGSLLALSGANGEFSIRSPYRASSNPSSDDWVSVTGMYNEPRSTYIHTGVDIGGYDTRPIYPAHGTDGYDQAWVKETGTHPDYGVYVWLRHIDYVSGISYYYDSFYAHMRTGSVKVVKDQTIYPNTQLGETGNTGKSTGPHLHLEFRTLYATDTSGAPRRWAPGVFYWRKAGTWGLDTSFITRYPDQGNTVYFRCIAKHSDGYYSARDVKLYYRIGGYGTWSSVPMQLDTQLYPGQQVYYANLGSLAYPGQEVHFYVSATETKYGYTAYRPWQHSDKAAPTERPFIKLIQ